MFKSIKRIFQIILILAILLVIADFFYLRSMKAIENYSADIYLENEINKKAVIITAHDDDAVSFAGTVSLLAKNGWEINQLCFYHQAKNNIEQHRNSERINAMNKLMELENLKSFEAVTFDLRKFRDPNNEPYKPIPYSQFNSTYRTDSISNIIAKYIAEKKPTVIFTFDDSIGGYGHPEHVLISQLISEYCNKNKNNTDFSVKKIYQGVFPPSMAENILVKNSWTNYNIYSEAKKIYKVSGMPLPDVEITISEMASVKKQTLASFKTEQNSLRKFWQQYSYWPAWIYFRIFNKEYFRVIEI